MKSLKSSYLKFIYSLGPLPLFLLKRKKMSIKEAYKIYTEVKKSDSIKLQPKSDTLAIMGSGYSINELQEKDFNYLKTIDVLAINHFAYHEKIIPDFYMYEGIKDKNFHKEAIRLLNLRAGAYKNTIYLFKGYPWFSRHGSLAEEFSELDSSILSRIKLLKVNFAIKAYEESDVTPELFNVNDLLGPHPQLKGSLTAALSLGFNMGYKNIILYGIDLGGPYFWEDKNEVKESKHFTAITRKQELTADKLIPLINEKIFQKENRSIYVKSKTSKLYPSISLWNYENQ